MSFLVSLLKVAILTVIIGGGTGSCHTTLYKALNEVLTVPSLGDRNYRAIKLKNGLVALLIYDPVAKKSAVAMDINVGSLEDLWEYQGLAHFLEHMLFLGTSKYPEVGEYSKYLADYQGYYNAYTSGEHTNYHSEVNHEGFLGALDRFAQFFISPLFTPEYVEREMNAVHSEHQKNLQNDFWRARMVARLTHRKGHPRQKFSTGDLETLKNVTNKILVDFYRKHYSANLMRLAVLSRINLDEQERIVTDLFAKIKNTKRKKAIYDSDIYDDNLLPQHIEIEPVADIKYVNLSFEMPSPQDYWKSKPYLLLGSLVGDEGKGSLLSLLKAKGYATALSSGVYASSYAGEFQTKITLTELGLAKVNEVVGIFFSYIAMLKEASLKEYFYQESKKLAQIAYDYRAPMEGASAVSFYSALIQRFPPLEALKNESLYFRFSPVDFDIFLNRIKVRKLKMTVVAKGVKTDKVEKHYGTHYSVQPIPYQVYRAWLNPELYKELHYPLRNSFIPRNLAILADDKRDKPYKLLANKQGVFWFQQDTEFLRPRAQFYLNVMTNRTNSNPREKLLSILYVKSLQESINEWKYPILTAGLNFNIARNDFGISVDIKGYSDKIPLLLSEIGQKLKAITIDEKRFASIKNKLKRDLANIAYRQGYHQAIDKSDSILGLSVIDYQEYAHLVDGVSLADVHSYSKEVFREMAFEGIAYGNLDKDILAQRLTAFIAKLEGRVLSDDKRGHEQIIKLNKKYNHSFVTESNNHALIKIIQVGQRSPKLDSLLRIIDTHINSPFYTELRTKQQLGYIVHSGLYYRKKMLGLRFIVQSPKYKPQEINVRIKKFFSMMATQFAELDLEKFKDYKRNIIEKLQEPEKTIFERHERLKAEAIKLDGDFDYRQQVITALQTVDKEELVEMWEKLTQSGQLSVSLFAKGSAIEGLMDTIDVGDIKEFKHTQPIYE